MKYRIKYQRGTTEQAKDFDCGSPITAINQFHTFMQKEMGYAPKAYKMKELALIHSANAYSGTPLVESKFDLPQSENPDILAAKKEPEPVKTEAMGFFAESEGKGRLAE